MDSDPILCPGRPDDFSGLITDALGGIQWQLMLFLFIIFLIITSDVFTHRILSRINGAVDMKQPTNYGVVLQGIFLVLFFTIIDVLRKQEVI